MPVHDDVAQAPASEQTTGYGQLQVVDLEAHLAEARDAAQGKGEFLATISHEMRTPMSGVLSMATMLLQSELTPDQRQIVELMRESTQPMLALLNDSMEYSRLEAGHLAVDTLDFDLRVTVDQIAGVLHPLAIGKGLAFESRVLRGLIWRLH